MGPRTIAHVRVYPPPPNKIPQCARTSVARTPPITPFAAKGKHAFGGVEGNGFKSPLLPAGYKSPSPPLAPHSKSGYPGPPFPSPPGEGAQPRGVHGECVWPEIRLRSPASTPAPCWSLTQCPCDVMSRAGGVGRLPGIRESWGDAGIVPERRLVPQCPAHKVPRLLCPRLRPVWSRVGGWGASGEPSRHHIQSALEARAPKCAPTPPFCRQAPSSTCPTKCAPLPPRRYTLVTQPLHPP